MIKIMVENYKHVKCQKV